MEKSGRRFYSDREVADRYGVSRSTIHNWVRAGLIPPGQKFGARTRRWSVDELEEHERAMREAGE